MRSVCESSACELQAIVDWAVVTSDRAGRTATQGSSLLVPAGNRPGGLAGLGEISQEREREYCTRSGIEGFEQTDAAWNNCSQLPHQMIRIGGSPLPCPTLQDCTLSQATASDLHPGRSGIVQYETMRSTPLVPGVLTWCTKHCT